MSSIVISGNVRVGGEDSRKKTCNTCGVTGGAWSKLVADDKTVWRHECGAEQ